MLLALALPHVVMAYDGPLVVDDANLLDGRQLLELEYAVRDVNRQQDIIMVILTVESLDGQNVSSYAQAVVQVWGIREDNRDNGLLLLIAEDQRVVHFEAGKDIRESLPPELLDRIKNEILEPALKDKQPVEGLTRTVAALSQPWQEPTDYSLFLWIIPAFIASAFICANTLNRKMRRCPHCGHKVRPTVIRCPGCLGEIRSGSSDPCPCGSKKTYADCCLDLHLDGRESIRIQFLRFLDIRYLLAMSTRFGGFTSGGAGELPGKSDKSNQFDNSKSVGGW
jgi:hypothetical protein